MLMFDQSDFRSVPKAFMIKLPFGLHNNHIMHISEVNRGLECKCVCPSCGQNLVAKKGSKVTHHFAHRADTSCDHAYETALHLAAKRILETERKIRIPAVQLHFDSHKEPWIIHEECDVHFDEVTLEHKMGNVVPDLVVYTDGRPLLIEVAVTHAVDAIKLNKLSGLGLSALEIMLADFPSSPTLDELKQEIVCSARSKKWLYNAKAEATKQKVRELAERKQVIRRGFAFHVDRCPIRARIWLGKPYANVIDDCGCCKYCADIGSGTGQGLLLCLGRLRINTYEDFLKRFKQAS